MRRILIILLSLLTLMSLVACEMPEQFVETSEPTKAPVESQPTEPTLPPFEECRVLTYYFQEPIPYHYYERYGTIEILEGTKIHLWIYDIPCYKGDAVRQLAPGDLLILGDREILVESVETNNIYEEGTYVINGGEGRDGVWLRPFTLYNVETKQMETDYTPCNSYAWKHYVLTEERDVVLVNRMNLHNTMEDTFEMTPEDFVQDLEDYSDKLCLHNTWLDMVDGKLEGITLSSGIDSQTDLTMIPDGLNPIDPDRLHLLMTGEEN